MLIQATSFKIPLADNSVHCCITSPPYWGLRDYSLEPMIFGGRDDCQHEWGNVNIFTPRLASETNSEKQKSNRGTAMPDDTQSINQFCQLCGAWLGSFGLEPTLALHVQNAVLVCREIKRVLRPDGTFWLNYGDSYSTSRNGRSAADGKATGQDDRTFRDKPFSTVGEVRAKSLCGIPWRVALALMDDGWILRSAPQWVKANAMPESVQDRPGNAHEYVFMLTKSERYFYDIEVIRRPIKDSTINRYNYRWNGNENRDYPNGPQNHMGKFMADPESKRASVELGRALRTSDFFFDSLDSYIAYLQDIRDNGGLLLDSSGNPDTFVINPQPYKYAHYATFPPTLVAPMVKASTSQKGCCPKCAAPWIRVKEPTPEYAELLGQDWADYEADATEGRGHSVSDQRPIKRNGSSVTAAYKTTGWRPSCNCQEAGTIPAIILDPFCGSGTTGFVSHQLGRRFIGIDLSAKYLAENALPRSEKKTSESVLENMSTDSQLSFF